MQVVLVSVLLLVALSSGATIDTFRAWAKQNNRLYTAEEEKARYLVFVQNLAIVDALNREGRHGAVFGLNSFSDLTNDEFKARYAPSNFTGARNSSAAIEVIPDNLNTNLDMRSYLPAIKNQGSCYGGDWAFSAVANAEGQYYYKHGSVLALSEQQLISCDMYDSGCDGGMMTTADSYILKNGLASQASYPWASGTGYVPPCKAYTVAATYTNAIDFGQVWSDSNIMLYLQQYGPLSAAVEADSYVFQSYGSGILDSTLCGTNVNHGVAITGYGTDSSGVQFWWVRNSWGTGWGEWGYIRLVRGKNMCGINTQLSTIIA
eukprot:m51a1_g6940 hypothetical protein (319) ;mRNA; f:241207-242227